MHREFHPARQSRAQRVLHQVGELAEDSTNQGLIGLLQVGKEDAQNRAPGIPAQHVSIAQQIGHALNEGAKSRGPAEGVGDAGSIHKNQQQVALVTLGTPPLKIYLAAEVWLVLYR